MAVFLINEEGELVASNEAHAAVLKRKPENIVGHNFREWTPVDQIALAEKSFASVLGGEPVTFERHVLRPDGSVAVGESRKFLTNRFNRPLVIGTLKLLHVIQDAPTPGAGDIAEYINDLTGGLAEMAARAGLHTLHEKLLDVASDAGDIALLLRAVTPTRQ